MNEKIDSAKEKEELSDFSELEAMFGQSVDELAKFDSISLNENLEAFAGCFPSWDLHPPVK